MKSKEKGTAQGSAVSASDVEAFKHSLATHLISTVCKDVHTATQRDYYYCLARTVCDRLTERWLETMRNYYRVDAKRVYYLSLEFLIGRTLLNSMLNLEIEPALRQALTELGIDLESIREQEPDAALGNGGLGRLAACFLDSMATLGLPGYGYGIRYEYGMFRQQIENGWQREHPDNWLRYGNPWEFPRAELLYPVKFGGRLVEYHDGQGQMHCDWVGTDDVMAMAYDTPIPGYGTKTVNNMRLWSAKSTREFQLNYFNHGNYIKAVEAKNASENLSRVLYPDDTTEMGRELRLKQQYFFVSASLQDILYRHHKAHAGFDDLPDKAAIQLNDTHPSIAIAEMMRLLLDVHGLAWEKAWDITSRTFSYTNHTLMPEALETWPVALFESVLPRHLKIIYEINHRFLEDVRHRHPGDVDLMHRLSIITDSGERRVRMSHLAIVGSHKVNGVSQIHTDLMKQTIFHDFDAFYPGKIVNVTNGVTPRRWIGEANPKLAALVTRRQGKGWLTDLERLRALESSAPDPEFQNQFRAVKQENKRRLAALVQKHMGLLISPEALFDVQVKRIHEYKRQLLNLLHVVVRYNRLRSGAHADAVPRVVIIAGKAAPAYAMAKLIIKLANDIADVINNDPAIGDRLKLVYVPNYDVSTAQDVIPAADLSEQISTAGTEASGTGNMKFSINGALTIGTLDGANVEMRQAVGEDNFFIFGMTAAEVAARTRAGYNPWDAYHGNAELKQALDMIAGGFFSPDDPDRFRPVFDALTLHGDRYFVLADFTDYIAAQERVDALYRDTAQWTAKAILNVARMGRFSSDRTIQEYAEKIWHAKPVERK
jgi:starch phosphorylase